MKDRLRKKKKSEEQLIASERIDILFGLAEKKALLGDLVVADSLVSEAHSVATKFNVRVPKKYKQFYCRKCLSFLLPGKTSKVRVNSAKKRVEVTCMKCGNKKYNPYVAEIKAKRRNK